MIHQAAPAEAQWWERVWADKRCRRDIGVFPLRSDSPGAGVAPPRAASCAAGVLLLAAAQAAYLYGPADLRTKIVLLSMRLPWWLPVALYALLLLVLLPGALASGLAGLVGKTPEGVRAARWALAAALAAAWILCTS
jgi:hypothetical protein